MQYRKTGRNSIRQFDSLPEVMRYIDTTPKTWTSKASHSNPAEKSWDLEAGYAGAAQMARTGWLEGAKEAQTALKVFAPRDVQPDTRVDFYGHMPHVARFCAGAPDSMVRHAKQGQTGGGKVLTLYVSIAANCGTDARYMRNYGIGLAQYINQIEQQGTRVELYAALVEAMEGGQHSYVLRVKRADQFLDLAVLAFVIGHPAMFRRIGFALIERTDCPTNFGYGRPTRVEAKHLINPVGGAVYLNGMGRANSCAKTVKAALKHLTDEIEAAEKE